IRDFDVTGVQTCALPISWSAVRRCGREVGAMMVTQMLHRSLAPLTGERRFDMDMPLLLGGIALLSLGLVMVSSASMEVAAGQLGSPLYYMKRQLVYMFIGV